MKPRMLERGWRIAATGFSFAVFGVGAFLLSITVFPLLAVVSRDAASRSARVQWVLHRGCRFFVWMVQSLGVVSSEVRGAERLTRHAAERGRMVVANHPSLVDVVFLLSWMPQADCIMKEALMRNPMLRWTVIGAGYIGNASPEGLIEDCVAALHAGRSLILFPEGTRTVPGQLAAFKRGAARIALQSGADILPVRIEVEPTFLAKGAKWWQVPARPAHFKFEIGAPFLASQVIAGEETPALAARQLTRHLQILLVPSTGIDVEPDASGLSPGSF